MYQKMLPILIIVVLNGSCSSPRLKAIYRAKSDSCNYRAGYFFETNQYDSASYAIEESLIWDSTNWAAYNNRAILKFHTGRPESEVVADFEKALDLKPDYEISLYSLANYYEEIKAYKKAVNACKQYSLIALTHDFDSTEAIRRLQQRCEEHIAKSQIIIDRISVNQAMAFYDSIRIVMNESLPIEQRFLDKLAKTAATIWSKRKRESLDVAALRNCLDSAKKVNQIKFDRISQITEVDSTIGYKKICIEYASFFRKLYHTSLKHYIDDLSTKNPFDIYESTRRLRPELMKIKQMERRFIKTQTDFKTKYLL